MRFSSGDRLPAPSPESERALGKELEIEKLRDENRMAANVDALKDEHIQFQDEHIKFLNEKYSKDSLTGLQPPGLFNDELAQVIKMVRRGMKAALISIDIDHFKAVNDGIGFGHAAGDEVLRRVARTLRDSVREADIVARLGGDELMVLLPDADTLSAARKAEELRAKIKALTFENYPGLNVTASLGVISLDGSVGVEESKELVDFQLYRAKRSGKNRVEVQGIENIT